MQQPVPAVFNAWRSSRFIANLIIERQAEIPIGSTFATTSNKVFKVFENKFYEDNPSTNLKDIVDILRSSIYVVDTPDINKLSDDESVFVICDTLYSSGDYEPILISNIPSKVEKAEVFYRQKNSSEDIPYRIYTTMETEMFLRGKFPDLSNSVDIRIEFSANL